DRILYLQTAPPDQYLHAVLEVLHAWPEQHRLSACRRLEDVLPAAPSEAAADEHHRRQLVGSHQLSDGVEDAHRLRSAGVGAEARAQTHGARQGEDPLRALDVPRRNQQAQIAVLLLQDREGPQEAALLPFVRRSADPETLAAQREGPAQGGVLRRRNADGERVALGVPGA